MAITTEERESIRSLVDESKETEEIAKKLHDFLKHDQKAVDRMRDIKVALDAASEGPMPENK